MKNVLTRQMESIRTIQGTENIVREIAWGRQVSLPQANALEGQSNDRGRQAGKCVFIGTVSAQDSRLSLQRLGFHTLEPHTKEKENLILSSYFDLNVSRISPKTRDSSSSNKRGSNCGNMVIVIL